jgi:hypothetical protein
VSESTFPIEEVPMFLGESSGLFGVLTRPTDSAGSTGVILMLTRDMTERPVGAQLAGGLARLGFPTFRFDASGYGESIQIQPSTGADPPDVADLKLSVAMMRTLGVVHIILIGNEEGAEACLTLANESGTFGLVCIGVRVVDPILKLAGSLEVSDFLRRALSRSRYLSDPERRRRYTKLARAKIRSLKDRRPDLLEGRQTAIELEDTKPQRPEPTSGTIESLRRVIGSGTPTLLIGGMLDRDHLQLIRSVEAMNLSLGDDSMPLIVTPTKGELAGFRSSESTEILLPVIGTWIEGLSDSNRIGDD